MSIPLTVLLWGLLAALVITSIGRWYRAHPGPPTAAAPFATDDPRAGRDRRSAPAGRAGAPDVA